MQHGLHITVFMIAYPKRPNIDFSLNLIYWMSFADLSELFSVELLRDRGLFYCLGVACLQFI